ncbi:MAG TPA: leucine--tRNA ligase [Sediminibacterium sp.]|uniref:leucine--tRNA ligase n=1 Tax=Sediminibacterium sp. TaxID=1917865 RepID=UPI0008AD9D71|nr:leucine--tRNA ligase [Sediminibacterium sp.]OHC86818.1 MAG: leucine--tRNA ligase [Sphingobacteriia bacterium RIFOXYC2_FULL_35_18]OHC88323.1 MAG: leucine--tRNA ligase [Sphingobacteriia bacterium RIFOXYD2_FULL_35_12]HLD51813.1 leucine--tRNA ligase [Sediminibacterium sp.]
MDYQFRAIEQKWQEHWKNSGVYTVPNISEKPKYYVLDMFPYPSGAGLHVGHPLGYIASDIFSRYKRLKGFNVLHPMGYDAFGLPAEQYAIEHGVHPATSTVQNINNFRQQLDNIGFSYDWSREVRTCEPAYHKWTQWIFLQLFNSFFNRHNQKATPIKDLIASFEKEGNSVHECPANDQLQFTAAEWKAFSEKEQQDILMQYRLAFCGYGEVNWCEALGTVLANDEVVNGLSERGGHPVVKKKLRQWYLRITEYADRLISGLDQIEFSEAMREMQTNWIGKSYGAEIDFAISDSATAAKLKVYTTRPDTIFGVDFMVVAPEHELIEQITTADQKQAVEEYIAYVKSRSDRERQAEKKITGCFTGAYALNPFNQRPIPIWISEYVLAGYGTGAIMAVPCGDERDFKFAKHFNIPITNIIGEHFNGSAANSTKEVALSNSEFLDGVILKDAIAIVIDKLVEMGIGKRKVNYKMRDAAFSRQRYWGEPFPIIWKDGIAYPLDESQLPLELPQVDSYAPGPEGEGPLANIPAWIHQYDSIIPGGALETNTMPGYAGSSWYFLRYMDPHNNEAFCDKKVSDYWNQVDLYIGGTEHAVGHLLYSRMWTKVLFDLGHISFDEPFRKLLNQGMIQGSSRFVYRNKQNPNEFISAGLINAYDTNPIHVDVNFVDGYELDLAALKQWRNGEYANATFVLENGKYICGAEVEKMSKSKFNTVNPDVLVEKYGADTFRMYEMFLGPVDQSKPWDTKGIEGVHRFLKKLWRLFYDELKGKVWNEDSPNPSELKVLHKTILKIQEDTERFSFNTAVSTFMICVNELAELKCNKKAILEQVLILLTPYAPHISEELWHQLGNEGSILNATFPLFEASYVQESSKDYPVSINGRVRANINLPIDMESEEAQKIVLANELVQKWLEGKAVKKFIFVKGRMINVVI